MYYNIIDIFSFTVCLILLYYFSTDFQKKIIAFCANIHVDIPDKDLLAPFTHESFLIANSKKLSRSYRCNEKLAFLGKTFLCALLETT